MKARRIKKGELSTLPVRDIGKGGGHIREKAPADGLLFSFRYPRESFYLTNQQLETLGFLPAERMETMKKTISRLKAKLRGERT
jgi:hypothetical protein